MRIRNPLYTVARQQAYLPARRYANAGTSYIALCLSHWCSQGGRAGGTPPPRNWVRKKIPGCAVELNTQNCACFGSQISLITSMSFREAMPPDPPTKGSAPGPRWGTSVPQTPCAPHLQILGTPLCVCLCLSQVGVLSKRLNESGWFLARELPSTNPTLCCNEIQVPSNEEYSLLELFSKLWT